MAGRTSEAQEVLETLTLRADSEYVLEFLRAHVYLGLGQMDKAFESLERAVVKRFDWPSDWRSTRWGFWATLGSE